jgi:hypothetical protein
MADSKAQKIVSVIIDAVKTILIADGFETNIGASPVEDWKTDFDEDELPGTGVCDLTETANNDENWSIEGFDCYKLPVQIRTYLSSATRAADARKIKADILKALNPLKDGFRTETETLAEKVELRRAGFELAEDGFRIVGIIVEIEIFYITQRFNAYE